ncbi:tRNA(Ile)-lysidine synthetase [Nitritalea halalkaliphila LW7]|uniref:tRNA(Ile)-lysidine synthetase n=1 Tax=Nitritalea halalkaliphila LW7 TaxID=1189621 RepID=I5C2J9_9BACT|nr:tRNA lysidine(34) synthetase TilS [Nitritalea halalkaliphila]EIM76051.1 tRNA(Ile)-lysidine synthetase [Nitritalea halalkaliphila LW7]
MLIDRGRLYLHPQESAAPYTFSLPEEGEGSLVLPGGKGVVDWAYKPLPEKWPQDPFQVYLNPDTLAAPLTLRTWQQGDRIQPFGMRGQKKVERLFHR